MYLGSWKIDDTLVFTCNTHTPSTGAATDADAVPTYRVHENETSTPILTGSTAKLDDVNTTGYYSEQLTLSAANGLEKGKTYTIYVSATVGSVIGTMSHMFQIEAGVAATPAEVATALTNIHLDHLFATDYDPAAKPGTATALLNEIIESDGGVSRYTANALENAPSAGTNPNVLINTTILSVTTQTEFTLTAGSADNDAYKNQAFVVYDASVSDFPSVRVCSGYVGSSKTVTLDSAPDFIIVNGDGCKVFVTAPGTTAPTVGQIRIEMEGAGYKLATIEADSNELQVNQGNWVTATGFSTHDAAAVKTAIEAAGSSITLIKAKTDSLPSGIQKNVALPKFDFLMVLSSDHISPATGKTVTGAVSKDGGAFAAITNPVSEVSAGMYVVALGLTQAEMNADIVTLKFIEADCDQRIITIHTT